MGDVIHLHSWVHAAIYTLSFYITHCIQSTVPLTSYLNNSGTRSTRTDCVACSLSLYSSSNKPRSGRWYVKPKRNLTLILCVTSPALCLSCVWEYTRIHSRRPCYTHCTFGYNVTTLQTTLTRYYFTYYNTQCKCTYLPRARQYADLRPPKMSIVQIR